MGWFSGSKRALEHRALPASDAPRRQPRSRPGGTILGELHPLTETVAEQGVKRFSPILGTPPRIELPILLNWTLAGCREAGSHGRASEQSRTDNWSPTGVFLAFWRCYCDVHLAQTQRAEVDRSRGRQVLQQVLGKRDRACA